MEQYRLPQAAAVGLDDVAPFSSNFFFLWDRKLYSSALKWWPLLVPWSQWWVPSAIVETPRCKWIVLPGHIPEGGSSSEDHTDSLDEVWIRAEEDFGLVRPEPGETMIAVHRQTSQRLAHAPDTWDEIPVHFEMPPEAILSDIAYGYNDIRANWEDATWWLCRVHESSRSSRQPVLALTNYVLVQGDDFLMADMRPHGLFELVLGDSLVVFPTFVPRWINLPILQTFLAPLVSRTHFGITVYGSYNGARIGNRLILCESGFFIRLHFQATVFLLGELYNSAPCKQRPCTRFLTTPVHMMCDGRQFTLRVGTR